MSDNLGDLLSGPTNPSTSTYQFSPTSGRSGSPLLPEPKLLPWEENETDKDKTNLPTRVASSSSGQEDLSTLFASNQIPKITVATAPSSTNSQASPTPPNSGAFFPQNPTNFGRSSLSTPTLPDASNFMAAGVIDVGPTPPNSGAVNYIAPTPPNSGAVNYVAPTPPNSAAFGSVGVLSNSAPALNKLKTTPPTPFNSTKPSVQTIEDWDATSSASSINHEPVSKVNEGQANFANALTANLSNLGNITKLDRKSSPYSPSGSSDSSPVSSPPASFGVHDANKSDVYLKDEDDDNENDFSTWMEDVVSEQKRYVKTIMKPVEKIYEQNTDMKRQIESLTQRLTAEESRNRQLSEKINHQDKQIELLLQRLENLEKREDRNIRSQPFEGSKSSSTSNLTSGVMKMFKGSQ